MKPNKDILNLANKLMNDKWMILPSVHKTLSEQVERFLASGEYPQGYSEDKEAHELDEQFDKEIETAQEEAPRVAIVEVNGVIMKHPSMIDIMMGAFPIDDAKFALQNAVEDDNVKSIVMWFNSPGGTTTGVEELGRYIKECDAIKPVYAFTDSMCASAAYWLASQCREVINTPSSCIGSVGVFALVLNDERAMEMAGLKVDAIYSGKYKLMGHTFHTLTESERKIIQDDVTRQHETFKQTIKSRRPEIQDSDMEGLTYEGTQAVEAHYADATVDSIEDLLEKLGETMEKENTASATATVPTKVEVAEPVKVEATAAVEVTPVKEEKIPGLPGVAEADPKDKDRDADQDGQKQDPAREKYQEDDKEPDGDECPCEKCGGTGKVKKGKKASDDEDEDDKEKEEVDKQMQTTAPVFQASLSNWKEAVGSLKLDNGQLEMKKENDNLTGWRKAQEAVRNQKG